MLCAHSCTTKLDGLQSMVMPHSPEFSAVATHERTPENENLRAGQMPQSLSKVIKSRPCVLFALVFFLGSIGAAQTLTGTVKNSSTGKPAAGDEVVLLKLGQGMEEAGRTKTNARGEFSFKLEDAQTPHLVRAIHQDVTYHRMAPPGTTSVEVEVYDVGKKIDGITVVADVMRIQGTGGRLEVTREFGIQNASKPPRTQMNEHNLEFYIPDGAHLVDDSATATTENGNPLKSAPVPEGEKNRYSFIFPLRPGLTRFELIYQLPYSGSANLDPKSLYPLEHFVVMLPKAMQFAAATPAGYKLTSFPSEPDASVQVASNTMPGQDLAFKLSGEGALGTGQEGAQGAGGGDESSAPVASDAQSSNRPGGGLGAPIDAPDPLQKYRWWILGSFAAVLVVGAVYVASRQQSAARALRRQIPGTAVSGAMLEEDGYTIAEVVAKDTSRTPTRRKSLLMEGLKEELFQLEVERRQSELSQEDYDKARAALDQALELALKREAKRP